MAPSLLAFATSEAGFDYFETHAHYRSLAGRIITVLGGFNVVLVTGDLPPNASNLSAALGAAVAGRYTVIGFSSEVDRLDLLRFRRALSTSLANGGAEREPSRLPTLIVFDLVDRFSDAEIEDIFNHLHQRSPIGDHPIAAVVLIASTNFLTRLEKPVFRFWLSKRLFVARLRFHELGADEIAAFIHHQLPLGERGSTFSDEAIAAIADVSGGDPTVVNRFSRRVLDPVTASISHTPVKGPVSWATVLPPDMSSDERGGTSFGEQPQQNHTVPELGVQLWTRMSRDRRVNLKLCAGAVFCFACVGAAAVVHMYTANEDVVASASASAKDTSAKLTEQGSLTGLAPPTVDHIAPAVTFPPEAAPESKPTAATAIGAPMPEEALSAQPTAASPPPVALRPEAPPVPQAQGTMMAAAIPPTAMGTEPAPRATMISPTGTQMAGHTTSVRIPPPAQLRLATEEITALLARGDKLLTLGDVSSARLFYERAADAGDERAALRLGKTFDPTFLYSAHLSVRGDSGIAVFWYSRARELGADEAETLLNHLETASPK